VIVEATKRCGGCGLRLSIANFSNNRTTADGLQSHCKHCKKQYYDSEKLIPEIRAKRREGSRRYGQSDRGKAIRKAWEGKRKHAPGPALQRRISNIQRTYRVDETFAAHLIAVPVCQACGKNFAHLGEERTDHCHERGHVRGVLCNTCNMATAGPAEAALHRLRRCINYLERDLERQCQD
jgi:hypothetical protein